MKYTNIIMPTNNRSFFGSRSQMIERQFDRGLYIDAVDGVRNKQNDVKLL